MKVLIPPRDWIHGYDPARIEVDFTPISGDKTLPFSVPPTVYNIVQDIIEDDATERYNLSSFATEAVEWCANLEKGDYKSAIHILYDTEARQDLTDFFLQIGPEWQEDDEPLTKADIIDATGLDRRSVGKHIDVLIEFGLVKATDNEDSRWNRYMPNTDSDAFRALHTANMELIEGL